MSTETVGLFIGTGAQDGDLDFYTAPELCRTKLSIQVNMVLNIHRNHKAYYGWGERGGGEGVCGWGRGRLYLSLHCHRQNNSCIKMGSDESHFNVSLIVRDKVTRQCSQIRTFEEKGEPKRNRAEALPSVYPFFLLNILRC